MNNSPRIAPCEGGPVISRDMGSPDCLVITSSASGWEKVGVPDARLCDVALLPGA